MKSDESNANELYYTPATALASAIRKRDISPVELVTAVLKRTEDVEAKVNCLVTLNAEQALIHAKEAEKQLMKSEPESLPPLFGIPITVKDLEDTAGVRTTYGSRNFSDHIPTTDAPIWARLKQAGAILLAKTTTPEFGCHGITESLLTGITNNPWDLTHTTGGSSGGAAAAVASGICPLATGSDGGGSIRVPSSFCGVVGLKPSVGRVPFNSRENAFESVVVTGPITRTVTDCALMMDLISGPSIYDAVSRPKQDLSYLDVVRNPSIKGLRVGFCPDLHNGPVDLEVCSIVTAAAEMLEVELEARVDVISISLPDPIEYFKTWWGPEFTMIYEDLFLSFGKPENIPRHMSKIAQWGKETNFVEYVRRRNQLRTNIHNAFADVFAAYDIMVWPTTPTAAFPHPGEAGGPTEINGEHVREPLLDNQRFTEAVSHAGYPAISIPAGFTKNGLPVGMQIAAGHGRDDLVLRAAAAFESVHPWRLITPPL